MSTQEEVTRLFEVLAHPQRRRLLVALEEGPATDDRRRNLAALAETIATHDDEEQERVRTQMVHTHLPKLADYGFVRWDRDTETVRKGTKWETLEPILDLLGDRYPDPAGRRAR